MDRRENPYTPNAGAPPPALAGREEQIENFDSLLDRLLKGYTDQSLPISGLRGVGKTVLLGEFVRVAENKGWTTVEIEFAKDVPFGPRMVRLAREALLDLAPRADLPRLARCWQSSGTIAPTRTAPSQTGRTDRRSSVTGAAAGSTGTCCPGATCREPRMLLIVCGPCRAVLSAALIGRLVPGGASTSVSSGVGEQDLLAGSIRPSDVPR